MSKKGRERAEVDKVSNDRVKVLNFIICSETTVKKTLKILNECRYSIKNESFQKVEDV